MSRIHRTSFASGNLEVTLSAIWDNGPWHGRWEVWSKLDDTDRQVIFTSRKQAREYFHNVCESRDIDYPIV